MVTDQNFEQEVLKSAKPVLVDFFATWCGPCQMLAPIIEELAEEYKDKAKILTMDIDENSQTAGQYQLTSVPTLIFFKGAQEVGRLMGLQQKGTLKEKLDELIQ